MTDSSADPRDPDRDDEGHDPILDPLRLKLTRELLKYAVGRQIFCSVTGETLDVRTAVYYEIEGRPFVNSHDGFYLNVKPALEAVGKEHLITDVIDGADLESQRRQRRYGNHAPKRAKEQTR